MDTASCSWQKVTEFEKLLAGHLKAQVLNSTGLSSKSHSVTLSK